MLHVAAVKAEFPPSPSPFWSLGASLGWAQKQSCQSAVPAWPPGLSSEGSLGLSVRSANPCLFSEANIPSHKMLQCPVVPLAAAAGGGTPRGALGSPDVCRSDFLSSLQVASFFVALVVMVTMLSLGIYLEPLPKVTQTSVQAEPLQHALSTPKQRHSLAPKTS